MGHERIGTLPKSKKWINILNQLTSINTDSDAILGIAKQTLINVEDRFQSIPYDKGVFATFKFLVCFSVSMRSPDPFNKLFEENILISNILTPLAVGKALKEKVLQESNRSLEYSEIAQFAALDALANWFKANNVQDSLFKSLASPNDIWRDIGTAPGFCTISRLFFAKYTERYLRYFLEREASAYINNVQDRELFEFELNNYIDDISLHAFEMSKITQSYAAGWFNKHTTEGVPTDQIIQEFVNYAFRKLGNEITGEAIEL
jgi:hypothetical protein